MAYPKSFGDDDQEQLAYDLRQIYANQIVGDHLLDVAQARKSNNYSAYFQALKDLYIVIHHQFQDEENDDKEYKKLLKKIVETAKKYSEVWLKKSIDPEAIAQIENVLNDLELFLYKKMSETNMFGSKYQYDEDEI